MKLELDKLRIDGGTQPRARLNQATVDEYAEAMERGAVFPPVTVFHDGRHIWLAEGFHRFHAHRKIGALKIDVKMQSGTQRDAILHSCGANSTHGLQRTTEDKRQAVQTLLDDPEWSKWSDREIARQCGVSHPFVAAIRTPEVAAKQREREAKRHTKVESLSTESDAADGQEVESLSTPTVQSGIPEAPESGGNASTATPLEKHDTTPGPVESKPAPKAKQPASLEDENAALRARVAELEELLSEQTSSFEETQGEYAEAVKVIEASDPLKQAFEQIKQLTAQVRGLRERQNGLMNEAAEAKRLAKSWRAKAEKLERAQA